MNSRKSKPLDAAELRRKAEALVREKAASSPKDLKAQSFGEQQRMLHELQVHQIELEMQNEELKKVQNELDSALEHYTELYDESPAGYLTLQPKGTISRMNLVMTTMLGMERSRLLNRRFALFVAVKDRSALADLLARAFATGNPEAGEVQLIPEGKPPLTVYLQARTTKDRQECRIVLTDITERKQVQYAFRESENKYRILCESSLIGIYRTTPDGSIVWANSNIVADVRLFVAGGTGTA